jgi:hypothetical protein
LSRTTAGPRLPERPWSALPALRLLLAIGINPLALAILETRGHVSGKTRRVPVGNGRKGDSFWIIAEHGTRDVEDEVKACLGDPHTQFRQGR